VFHGVLDQLGTGLNVELFHHPVLVEFNGPYGDIGLKSALEGKRSVSLITGSTLRKQNGRAFDPALLFDN
jgi:hypothetical protein